MIKLGMRTARSILPLPPTRCFVLPFAGPGGQFTVDDYARMLANLMKREKQRQAEGHKPGWNGGGSCLVRSLDCGIYAGRDNWHGAWE